MNVIEDIRSGYDVDRDEPTRIQQVLERALDHLSDQLYRTDSHFIMEFVQNADDNNYASNVTPTLRMRVEDLKMVLSSNETGFEERNVRSISDIGDSTKKNMKGFIGEKGIGFKSVFKVADVVHVASGPYTFKFDRKEKLGMIAPIWDDTIISSAGMTTFTLDLTPPKRGCPPSGVVLSTQLREIRPSLLLFLGKLRAIEIEIAVRHTHQQRSIHIARTDLDSNIIQLSRVESGPRATSSTDRYFIVKEVFSTTGSQEKKRLGVNETEIVLAFPVDERGFPKVLPQDVHAFLPMRKFGFNFLIQADFLTSSSREDVLEDSPWNLRLRDAIVETFIKATRTFRGHKNLQDSWIRFLPNGIVDTFFKSVETTIFSKLKTSEIVRDSIENYQVPSNIITVPHRFTYRGSPLIPCKHMRLSYLSTVYNKSADIPWLNRLGVRDMNDADFLNGLSSMSSSRAFMSHGNAWHDAICSVLMSIQPPNRNFFDHRILDLDILPLDDGTWARAGDADKFMFDAEVSGIPDHVEYRRISASVIPGSNRHSFFSSLGVQAADPVHIAEAILNSYGSHLQVKSHVDNARFFFLHRNDRPSLPDASRLQLIDEQGLCDTGRNLYLDWPGDKASCGFKGMPDYETWLNWLPDRLMVNTAPRLINNRLSPEFEDMIRRLHLPELLETLKTFWSRWPGRRDSPWRNQLSCAAVNLNDGSQSTMDSMFLRRGGLARHGNLDGFFLPVPDPDSSDWDFLSTLGVSMDVNANFYLKLLIRHQESAINDLDEVENIYKQLDARFYEESARIRQAFKARPLIYNSKGNVWTCVSDVYWDGPQSMISKIRLRTLFPFFSDFFRDKLQIPNAPPSIIFDELKKLSAQWHGKIIGKEVHQKATSMLIDLEELVKKNRVSDVDVQQLVRETSIFPASNDQDGIRLYKLSEIYIPDRDDRFAGVFRGKVLMLHLSSVGKNFPTIDGLLQSPACADLVRRIENYVDRRTDSYTEGDKDFPLIAKFTRNCEFIERLLHNGTNPSKRQLEVLSKLKEIDIRIVTTISSTLSLDGIELESSELIDFSEGDSKFIVLYSKEADANKIIMHICGYLHRLLQMDCLQLYQAVTSAPQTLEFLFQLANVNEVASRSLGDYYWLSPSAYPSRPLIDKMRPNPIATSSGGDQRVIPFKSSGIHVRGTFTVEDVQTEISRIMENISGCSASEVRIFSSEHFPSQSIEELATSLSSTRIHRSLSPDSTSINVSKLEAETQPGSSNSTSLEPTLSARIYCAPAPHAMASILEWDPPMSYTEASQPSPTQKINGVLGELHVYMYLSKLLGPTFGPDNWTSELRSCVRGFEPFNETSLADFTYEDKEGTLTNYLYKDSRQTLDKWSTKWPKYHIEVKSTSSSAQAPFHISQRQFDIAMMLAINRESEAVPKDVYVIVRVWNVRNSSESLSFFIDPSKAILDRKLRIVSESVEFMIGD